MAEESDDDTYCLCRRAYSDGDFMIQCDICKDWFHGRLVLIKAPHAETLLHPPACLRLLPSSPSIPCSCVGVEEHQAGDIDTYHCPNCQPEHGPLTCKSISTNISFHSGRVVSYVCISCRATRGIKFLSYFSIVYCY